jgi:hypothetical protein
MSEQNAYQSKEIIFCNDPASTSADRSYYFFSGTPLVRLGKDSSITSPIKVLAKA